jgi:hypothetical protein
MPLGVDIFSNVRIQVSPVAPVSEEGESPNDRQVGPRRGEIATASRLTGVMNAPQ